MGYKIAICLSGQLRKLQNVDRFSSNYEIWDISLKQAFKGHDVDYYIHTWDHEYNINLPHLEKYFPDATVEVETYEKFDQVIDDIFRAQNFPRLGTDQRRYWFVQYYTILKSLQLAKKSNIEYDFIVRIRSDIRLFKVITKEGLEQYAKHTQLDYEHLYSHGVLSLSKKHITGSIFSPFMYAREIISIRDFIWLADTNAFDTLTKLTEYDILHLVFEIVKDFGVSKLGLDKITLYDHLTAWKAPVIWPEIFNRLGIVLTRGDYLGLNGKIIRGKDDSKFKSTNYGVIR